MVKEEFFKPDEVQRAFESEQIDLHAKIKVRIENAEKGVFIEDTTVGRTLIWRITPIEVGFDNVNKTLIRKQFRRLLIFPTEKLV